MPFSRSLSPAARVAQGRRLRKARELKRLTQQAVADAVGVTRLPVERWELGRAVPAHHHRRELAKVLDVAEAELFPELARIEAFVRDQFSPQAVYLFDLEMARARLMHFGPPWQYRADPDRVMHLSTAYLAELGLTLCETPIAFDWTVGGETLTGDRATCDRCAMRPKLIDLTVRAARGEDISQ